jgi:heterokaryon incompatibility protein (HET)
MVDSYVANFLIPGVLRQESSGSPMAYEHLKKWMKRCDEHDECVIKDLPRPLPKRALEVVPGGALVMLRETNGQCGNYIALSHCWGTTHRLTLTRANLNTLKDGIVISQLPATFRDAIYLAGALKIRYVWIDSLCIVQDDVADWEVEASKMGDVYANSYLSVAALSSTDDSSGCFPNPETRFTEPFASSDVRSTGRRCIPFAAPVTQLDMRDGKLSSSYRSRALFAVTTLEESNDTLFITPEWMPSSMKKSPKLYHIGAFGQSFDPIDDEPLSKRAWTMQERILAPRTIHYGRTEMYWECQKVVRAEDGAYFQRTFPRLQDIASPKAKSSEHNQVQNLWYRLIENYTSRNLTRDEDKLPALSGMVKLMVKTNGDEYYAGIWRSDFVGGLNWSVELYEPQHFCDDPNHDAAIPSARKSTVKRPTNYRAPSWSWASLDAKVQYRILDHARATSCIDVQVMPVNNDPFGRIKSGHARLMVRI